MAKFTAWEIDTEAKIIAEKLIEKYPQLFRHVDVEKICFVRILNKKSTIPTKVEGVKFPYSVHSNNVYYVTVFNDCWATLETAHRNLAIAQALYSIHVNGFEEQSAKYGKLVKPDVVTFLEISCMAGNIPNWLNNASVSNPLEME